MPYDFAERYAAANRSLEARGDTVLCADTLVTESHAERVELRAFRRR